MHHATNCLVGLLDSVILLNLPLGNIRVLNNVHYEQKEQAGNRYQMTFK